MGACDSETCEQLAHNGWKGLVIEPVLSIFNNLTRHEGVIYKDVAISEVDGEDEVCFVDLTYAKGWRRTGPLSFSENMSLPVARQKVRTRTLPSLCKEHGISSIDFLKFDTEGYDNTVLHSIRGD